MDVPTARRGFPWTGVLIGCAVVALGGLGLVCGGIVWLLSGHEGGVRLTNEMEPYATEYLEEHEILNDSESLIAYYDATISLDGTEAAILTTERLIYHKDGKSTSIPLGDIEKLRHRNQAFVGDVIMVDSRSSVPMKIEIAPLNQGHSFLNALEDAWNKKKQPD